MMIKNQIGVGMIFMFVLSLATVNSLAATRTVTIRVKGMT